MWICFDGNFMTCSSVESGVEVTSLQLYSYIKRLNNNQKRICMPCFIR